MGGQAGMTEATDEISQQILVSEVPTTQT